MIIRYTKHAIRRMEDYYLTKRLVEEKIIAEGEKVREGRRKIKFVLCRKNKILVAICAKIENELNDELTVITVVETHKKR